MFKQFLNTINLKKHLFAYVFILVFFSLLYAFAFSMIYTLCSMSNSILPLLIGNYILYIAAAYIMSRVHFSMMMLIRQKEKYFKTLPTLIKVLVIYSILYLLIGVGEFFLPGILMIIIQVIAVVYMPLQIYLSKSLYEELSIIQCFKNALCWIKKHYMSVFYLGIIVDVLAIALKYFVANDFLFLSELGNFAMFYNPYLGIYDLFNIDIFQVIIVFVVGILIIIAYSIYSLYLMWEEEQ